MNSQTHQISATCHRSIESIADAKTVVTECLQGNLKLSSRCTNKQQAMEAISDGAVFVYDDEAIGDWLNPLHWRNGISDSEISTTVLQHPEHGYLTRKSIIITMVGHKYHVVAYSKSSDPSSHDSQPADKRHKRNEPLLWPSQLVRNANNTSFDIEAYERLIRDRGYPDVTDKKN